MLFNSYQFIFLFLPITLILYFVLCKFKFYILSQTFLIFASLYFYSYWKIEYLLLIILSILFNYFSGKEISKDRFPWLPKKKILIIGIIVNLSVLGYFKYADFFITNFNYMSLKVKRDCSHKIQII